MTTNPPRPCAACAAVLPPAGPAGPTDDLCPRCAAIRTDICTHAIAALIEDVESLPVTADEAA